LWKLRRIVFWDEKVDNAQIYLETVLWLRDRCDMLQDEKKFNMKKR
jgi:hypothetical protein